ncbi:MAG: hypothetical protein C0469_02980 [Cyanobacteria bacterium DS2.3.42]|nr:hypothetical protein [Cyanobacteria bacterium DS2.3.42]
MIYFPFGNIAQKISSQPLGIDFSFARMFRLHWGFSHGYGENSLAKTIDTPIIANTLKPHKSDQESLLANSPLGVR